MRLSASLIAHEMLALAPQGRRSNLVLNDDASGAVRGKWWCDGWAVDLQFTNDDLALSLDDFSNRYCVPAVKSWAYGCGVRRPEPFGLPAGCRAAVMLERAA